MLRLDFAALLARAPPPAAAAAPEARAPRAAESE
jgi:hypothetical protein